MYTIDTDTVGIKQPFLDHLLMIPGRKEHLLLPVPLHSQNLDDSDAKSSVRSGSTYKMK